VIQNNTAKGSKTKQWQVEPKQNASGNITDLHDGNHDTSMSDSSTLAEICRRHHCDRCKKACYIDPGPPPVHKPFTMEQLSVWTSLVVRQNSKLELSHAHYVYIRNSKRQQLINSQMHYASPSVEIVSLFHLLQQVVLSLKLPLRIP
jgi:hypothetical protein